MRFKWLYIASFMLTPLGVSAAVATKYCTGGQAYINVGMSQAQVLKACGQPVGKRPTKEAVVQQVPVTQLIYTRLNRGGTYRGYDRIYQLWSLPSGTKGISLQVDVIDNKISGISLNGSSTNASNLCGGKNFQVGDPVNNVYSACGNPTITNNTFINQTIPRSQSPEVWIYQVDPYQAPFNLTFVNGKLQSID
jgi:hypothetical protein